MDVNLRRGNTWAIVLAGGAGRRLESLTTRLYGRAMPKQFAVLCGTTSLLQDTIERLEKVVSAERQVVVVPGEYGDLARAQLMRFPRLHLLTQPDDRGTGPGLILPLAWIRRQDPTGRVVATPADHFVPDPSPFLQGMQSALRATETGRLVLLGVKAQYPETSYGWIVTGRRLAPGLHEVKAFVEKPAAAQAEELFRSGALWNTFVFAGTTEVLWNIVEEHLPDQSRTLERYFARRLDDDVDAGELARVYAKMPAADFSRQVLQRAIALGVVEVASCGWSDWGTPERVFGSLAGTPQEQELNSRLT